MGLGVFGVLGCFNKWVRFTFLVTLTSVSTSVFDLGVPMRLKTAMED
ncbi:uncharacterized protein G2W53_020919 [Senna tora]|uniref:Uncharacterized protein n=1 Tax=Senna tora TaxID=362788 RepID=A0A834TL02_9FABA|nr:uncharacterized protein G2W53_020919 [Senna tora]